MKGCCFTPHQLSYVTQSGEGEGLLFYGSVILPFVDRFPKEKAAEPPKPRKRSLTELAAAKREGLPLTPEEEERLAAYRQRKNEAVKRCRERKIAKEAAEKAEKGEKIA